MIVTYRQRPDSPTVTLRIPGDDWMKLHDTICRHLWPNFRPSAPDPVFERVMKRMQSNLKEK